MQKITATNCPGFPGIILLFILFIFSTGKQLFAQEKNEIDEKGKPL